MLLSSSRKNKQSNQKCYYGVRNFSKGYYQSGIEVVNYTVMNRKMNHYTNIDTHYVIR